MLGFADGTITLVFLLCIGSVLLCTAYGLVNWHRGAEAEPAQIREEADWESRDVTGDEE
jgi:hypothetical protein